VYRQFGLGVGGQPEIRKIEMVEGGSDGSGDPARIEPGGGGGWAFGRKKAAGQSGRADEEDGENKYEPVAAPALATARPWVTA
jgi:hypothetical protein